MPENVLPIVYTERCIACGACLSACPHHALSLETHVVLSRPEDCTYCGTCEEVCPSGAIELYYEIIDLSTSSDKENIP